MKGFNKQLVIIVLFLMMLVYSGLPAQPAENSSAITGKSINAIIAEQPDTTFISLSDILQEAVSNNELLKKADARILAAYAALEQTKGEMLPKVDANFNYTYLDIVPGFKNILLGNNPHDIFPNLMVSQTLYSGGKLKHMREAANIKTRSVKQAYLAQQLDIKLSVCINFFKLQSLLNQKIILTDNLKQLQIQQRYTRLQVNAGRMSQLELDRISVAMTSIEGDLLKIDNEYSEISNQLILLSGRQAGQLLIPQNPTELLPYDMDDRSMLGLALENNPAWKQMELDLQRAQQMVKVQEAARLPKVSANAYYGYEFGLESFSFNDNKRYYAGLNASVPIYHGKIINEKIIEAEAEVEQISWQKEYLKKNLATQLQNKYNALKEAEQQIMIREQGYEQAKKSYQMALLEYNAGRRSNTDLLDILNVLLESRILLDQSRLNYNTAVVWHQAVMGIL